jgi:hypothetical protein
MLKFATLAVFVALCLLWLPFFVVAVTLVNGQAYTYDFGGIRINDSTAGFTEQTPTPNE